MSCRFSNDNDFKNCQVICLTETWLQERHSDNLLQPTGFSVFRSDRDLAITGKDDGGGVCFIINNQWCNSVKLISKGCTKNLEHLTLKCRPFYLPREFSSITITAVYIHPHANTKEALDDLNVIVSKYEESDPDTASIILGDFNQANLRTVLPNFHQVITCPTRQNNTLDHCYTKVKSAYTSRERSGLGNSDHSTILLLPKYTQKVKQTKPISKVTSIWSQSAVDNLQYYLEDSDWIVFLDGSPTIHTYTETVLDYVNFCVDVCIPSKVSTIYANNKRWFDKNIRNKIILKDKAYRNKRSDPDAYRDSKKELKKAIKENKRRYKEKLEDVFKTGDSRALWSHMSDITQYKGKQRQADTDDTTLPDRLNEYYARFDRDNKTTAEEIQVNQDSAPPFSITELDVRRSFKTLKENKAAGPDHIKPKLLRLCSDQLAYVFTYIFNWSLGTTTIPLCFKKSIIIPVPKKNSPECLNDFRPVALTSVVMKCFEKIVLRFINSLLSSHLDTFQFAYRPKRSIDDAISINMHEILNHLEYKNTYARVLFIDYSSAFNTIIPCKLYSKLVYDLKFPLKLCNWLLNFLLERPQVVKIGNTVSSTLVLNTGTPQGCPLSPKLYSLFTFDCISTFPGNLVIKFADDTTVTGLISNNDETDYRLEIERIVNWCERNNLFLNVSKTKEMVIDYRKNKCPISPLFIQNTEVEQISSFKFLGTYISDDLNWSKNCNEILKKAKQRLYFLRQLKYYHVNSTILCQFYKAIIQSILTSSILVWFDRATQHDLYKLSAVIKHSERIVGLPLPSLIDIYLDRLDRKTKLILSDESHPASKYFSFLPSGRRLRQFKGNKRFLKSTYPQAVKNFNGTRDI